MFDESRPHLITQLLGQAREGDAGARERLMGLVHDELSRVARRQMLGERAGHTLQTAELVNETYLQLFGGHSPRWPDRNQFFAYASAAMRHFLIGHARRRQALKRGGEMVRVTLSGIVEEQKADDLIALDDALARLAEIDRRKSEIIEMRFFGGLSIEEICQVMALSPATVHKELKAARGWLYLTLEGEQ